MPRTDRVRCSLRVLERPLHGRQGCERSAIFRKQQALSQGRDSVPQMAMGDSLISGELADHASISITVKS